MAGSHPARLRLVAALLRIARLRLPGGRRLLRRRHRGDAGLGSRRRRRAGRSSGAAAELAQAFLELPVAVLQLLILAGHLPELVLQPLDTQLKVRVLGQGGRCDDENRGSRHGRECLVKPG